MALTITGRLLCAARQAYQIKAGQVPTSPPTPAPPPSTLVGWLAGSPQWFIGGDDGIDAVLFGETETEFILAFRGTEPPDSPDHKQAILDWANNLNTIPEARPDMPGLVHPGFWGALDALWPQAFPAVQAAVAATPAKPLYITGHSKGGAIAPLAAIRCETAGLAPYVCTFAAAKSGDQVFATAYDARVPHSTRYEYQDDLVPHLPPSDAFAEMMGKIPWFTSTAAGLNRGYVAVGELAFIDWNNQIVGYSPDLYFDRLFRLGKLMLTFGFSTIIGDHDLDPGSGYATAACPGVWPPKPHP